MKLDTNDYNEQEIIKFIREWTGLTQKEFGETVNLSQRCVEDYEQGLTEYTFATLLKIAKKCDLKITIEKRKAK